MTVIMRIRHGARADREARSDLPTPQVIRDSVDYLWNPVDGTRITSKRAYAKQLSAQGLAIDERPRLRDKSHEIGAGLRQDILRAMQEPARLDEAPVHIPGLDDAS